MEYARKKDFLVGVYPEHAEGLEMMIAGTEVSDALARSLASAINTAAAAS